MAMGKCAICGKEYQLCNNCDKLKELGSWKSVVDSPSHFFIYSTLHMYTIGKRNIEQTKKELELCDLSDLDEFLPHIKAEIEKILKYKKSVEKQKFFNAKNKDSE